MSFFFFFAPLFVGLTHTSVAEPIDPIAATTLSSTAAETARTSDGLVDFFGVNARLSGSDATWQTVSGALRTLGVRHLRDAAEVSASQTYFDRHTQLSGLAIKSIFAAPKGASAATLEGFAARVSADVEGLEAASGLDATDAAAWMRDTKADVDSVHTAATALGVSSYGPTLSLPSAYALLGDLSTKENFASVGSLPCVGEEERASWNCASSVLMRDEAAVASKPFVVTGETLAQTAASQLPPAVAAVYLPRVLLEEWNAGAQRSYRADVEPGSANDFALLSKTGAETPAFRAMQGLIGLLKDTGATFTPGSLSYSLSGVDSSVHHALFQKRDGTFYLALWIEASSYDRTTHKMIAVPGQVAKLETASAMGITTYEFDETGAVTTKSGGLSTPQMIPVTDRLLVVKLTPAAAVSAAAAATAAVKTDLAVSAATVNAATKVTAATYYVANSGNDANDGLSAATPWKTIAKVNASTALYVPGTSVLLKRGDVFHDDYIRLVNKVSPVATTTLANTPLPIAGTAAKPIVIGAYGTGANPLIDGADPLSVTWTRVTATTWKATVATLPSKLYVDSTTAETVALTPQPNAKGAWRAGTAYNFLDLVTDATGLKYVVYSPSGTIATPSLPYGQPWQGISNTVAGNTSQTFSATNSGLANVEATAGSWYGTGTTMYVHLADGSNPNTHVIEGTYRPYGVLLMSTNYVTVENLSIERVLLDGIAMGTFASSSLAGKYYTNEYNSALSNNVWNWGNVGSGCLPMIHVCSGTAEAGILSKGYSYGEAVRGTVISGNYVGRSDQYLGLRSHLSVAGIAASGQNAAVVTYNKIVTVNNMCLNYGPQDGTPGNTAGEIGYNTCGNNQGNFFISQTTGGRIHHNIAGNSFGEGIQVGGNDYGIMIDHNLLYKLGITASRIGWNGIDCNASGRYLTFANNTIVDTYGANLTLETSCDHAYIVNNIFDQPLTNHGAFFYWLTASSTDITFRNNLYSETYLVHPWYYNYLIAQWKVVSGDSLAQQANPVFVDAATGDYRLVRGSVGTSRSTSVSIADVAETSSDLGANLETTE